MTLRHIEWMSLEKFAHKASCGRPIQFFKFVPTANDEILSAWAKHFRQHYCPDDEIDELREGYGFERGRYLEEIVFPDEKKGFGPGIRAGDFAEILITDYLQFALGYWSPRTRFYEKEIRNQSEMGNDILAFKLEDAENWKPEDELYIWEVKAQLSLGGKESNFQKAVIDCERSELKKAESLNAARRRLKVRGDSVGSMKVRRFQNIEDRPYKMKLGAGGLIDSTYMTSEYLNQTDGSSISNDKELSLLVMHGNDLMKLVHSLYKRAIDEA